MYVSIYVLMYLLMFVLMYLLLYLLIRRPGPGLGVHFFFSQSGLGLYSPVRSSPVRSSAVSGLVVVVVVGSCSGTSNSAW
jgi:hypothetical protein